MSSQVGVRKNGNFGVWLTSAKRAGVAGIFFSAKGGMCTHYIAQRALNKALFFNLFQGDLKPFRSPEPLGLICNRPVISRSRDQDTTGSGDENDLNRVKKTAYDIVNGIVGFQTDIHT